MRLAAYQRSFLCHIDVPNTRMDKVIGVTIISKVVR